MDYVNKFSKFNKLNEESTEKSFEDIIEEADDAFWAVIAASYPEIKSGDFSPEATLEFQQAQIKAVRTWLDLNKPQV